MYIQYNKIYLKFISTNQNTYQFKVDFYINQVVKEAWKEKDSWNWSTCRG